jgi:hypothetical protein
VAGCRLRHCVECRAHDAAELRPTHTGFVDELFEANESCELESAAVCIEDLPDTAIAGKTIRAARNHRCPVGPRRQVVKALMENKLRSFRIFSQCGGSAAQLTKMLMRDAVERLVVTTTEGGHGCRIDLWMVPECHCCQPRSPWNYS